MIDYFDLLPKEEQAELLLGAICYGEGTKRHKKAISKEQLNDYSTKEIRAIFRYLMTDLDIDVSTDMIAFDTLENTFALLEEREPLPPHKEKTEEELKADLKRLFERAGYEYKP